MKNFFTGVFFILTAVIVFWTVFIGGVYVWQHMSTDAKALVAIIGGPTFFFSIFFAPAIGENYHNWRNGRAR